MKILLATTVDNLAEKFAVLNSELNYCALVTGKRELAKEILDKLDLSNVPLYPMSELKTCTKNFNYDYLLCIQDGFYRNGIMRTLQKYNFPTEKVINFAQLQTAGNWQTERHLRYYREHAQNFEMFATGTSYAETAIDIRKFKYKAFNFATSSQDLYYNFQIAKSIVLYGGGIVRYDMPLSDLRPIPSISTFPRHFYGNLAYCLILLLLMTYIIYPYLSKFTKNFLEKSG